MAIIKVADLIASRDIAGHNAAHDDYFGHYPDWRPLGRKPFFAFAEVVPTLSQLAAVIDMADLYPGVKVLDYGCGTGWLARSLAYLGCDVTGVDVSQRAIGWARETIAQDRLCDGLPVRFELIDGVRMPFDDACFERIICFSAFHHVADQAGTLREMARVLAGGGRAVFNEPAPGHSLTPEAQAEMRDFGVIENDLPMQEIVRQARACGFDDPKMACYTLRPLLLDWDDYQRMAAPDAGPVSPPGMQAWLDEQLRGTNTFMLAKGSPLSRDSRRTDGLAGKLELSVLARDPGQWRWRAHYTNSGARHWRASIPVETGSVSIGIKKMRPGGGYEEARVPFGRQAIAPGQTGSVEFSVATTGFEAIAFDLVSEWVTWFGDAHGNVPQLVRLTGP